MPRKESPPRRIREPVQVYLAPDDSELLTRLSQESNLSKAEVLRRGVRSFARELATVRSPMLAFLEGSEAAAWSGPRAVDHDAVLATEHRARRSR